MESETTLSEELEALTSVYSFSINIDQKSNTIILSRRCFPRTAETSTAFVFADLEITLFPGYPDVWPLVSVSKTCGIADEGKKMSSHIQNVFAQLMLGEPMLFQIMEAVFDFLDSVNDGECFICLDSLRSTTFNIEFTTIIALRTACFHCFHLGCIMKWGATHGRVVARSRTSVALRDADEGKLRAAEGQYNAHQCEVGRLEEQYQSHLLEIREIEARISNLTAAAGALEAASSKAKASAKPKHRSDSSDENVSISSLLRVEHTLLESRTRDCRDIAGKVARVKARLDQESAIVLDLRAAQEDNRKKTETCVGFPCPCCRAYVDSTNCLAEVPSLFSEALKWANDTLDVGVLDAPSAECSVRDLPSELQDVVRNIQKFQFEIKQSSVRCSPKSCSCPDDYCKCCAQSTTTSATAGIDACSGAGAGAGAGAGSVFEKCQSQPDKMPEKDSLSGVSRRRRSKRHARRCADAGAMDDP